MARARADVRGALSTVLPNAFAGLVSRVEALGPTFSVVERVAAPPEIVYRVISDVSAYGEWSPWIVGVKGVAERPGDEVTADVKLRGGTMRVGHRVLVASPPWRGMRAESRALAERAEALLAKNLS